MKHLDPIIIPAGIRYLSDWKEFKLPDFPCIIDKKLTGCGFTEYVIRGDFNSVLISPRTSLLKNKVRQHNQFQEIEIDGELKEVELPDERVLYYATSQLEKEIEVDKDLLATKPKETKDLVEIVNISEFKNNLKEAIQKFIFRKKPIKLCVTYDSFRKVKEVLQELKMIDSFHFIVDEFQVIFTDSRFKPDTELEFVYHLQDLQKVTYISATPYMEDYLDELDEFKNLPFIEMDWKKEDESRIFSPELIVKSCRGINEVAKKYISDLKAGIFAYRTRFSPDGKPLETVESKELIFYVNSVKNICDIIKQNQLTPDEVNVICAQTDDNKKKVREAFKEVFKIKEKDLKDLPSLDKILSEVPVPNKITGEVKNKPITFCTKTVYLGADFYSTNARSIILSDATIESLAVDITLDLSQILGRQRLDKNPWKNAAEIWVRYGMRAGQISQEEFDKRRKEKIENTKDLLDAYNASPDKAKKTLVKVYERDVKRENYKDNYVAINYHAGSDLKPQFNQLVMISEKRAFKIQKDDYANRFNVMKAIVTQFGLESIDEELQLFMEAIESSKIFSNKINTICKYLSKIEDESLKDRLSQHIPEPFKTYYFTLGPDVIMSLNCKKNKIEEIFNSRTTSKIYSGNDIREKMAKKWIIGKRYTNAQLKEGFEEIYTSLGITKKIMASDIENWFDVKLVKITNKETKKRDFGYEILSLKS